MATALTAHFTLEELNPHGNALSSAELANLRQLAALLERVRAAVGVPLRVSSGHRTPAQNKAAGGVATSEHLTGAAADVVPVGLSRSAAAERLRAAAAAGQLGAFGQLILYPYTTGHVHVSLADGHADGQVLEKLVEGGYRELIAAAVDQVRSAVRAHPSVLLLFIGALVALLIFRRGGVA